MYVDITHPTNHMIILIQSPKSVFTGILQENNIFHKQILIFTLASAHM